MSSAGLVLCRVGSGVGVKEGGLLRRRSDQRPTPATPAPMLRQLRALPGALARPLWAFAVGIVAGVNGWWQWDRATLLLHKSVLGLATDSLFVTINIRETPY